MLAACAGLQVCGSFLCLNLTPTFCYSYFSFILLLPKHQEKQPRSHYVTYHNLYVFIAYSINKCPSFLGSNRTSSTSGTAVTAALLQMWRRSDMRHLFSSCSGMSSLLKNTGVYLYFSTSSSYVLFLNDPCSLPTESRSKSLQRRNYCVDSTNIHIYTYNGDTKSTCIQSTSTGGSIFQHSMTNCNIVLL